MLKGRTSKSFRNMLFGMGGLLINLILTFVSKSVFIATLGAEYNGVNALFSNILSVLNLAELGLGGSIAFALYKPLAEGDEQTVAALMSFFAKVYRIISLTVMIVGLLLLPILQYLIKEDFTQLPFSLSQIKIFFILYLVNTSASYLIAYKRTIITADQNEYLASTVDNICNFLLTILQIILLLLTKNYYAFLGIMITRTVLNNIIIQIIANKKYPYLKTYAKLKLPKELRSNLFKSVKAMAIHRVSSVIILSTTTIVISTFIGIKTAGLYGNYMLIVANVSMLTSIIFGSIAASVGNLCVGGSQEKQMQVMKIIDYIALALGNFTFVSFIVVFNPFIKVWIGEDNLLSMTIVVLISLTSYIFYTRRSVLMFQTVKGLFIQDRYKPVIEATVGIGLAIGLSYVWGLAGVLLGYIIAVVVIAIPIETHILFKLGFKRSMCGKMLVNLLSTLITGAIAAVTYLLCSLIPLTGVPDVIVRILICLVVPNVLFIAATCWTREFKMTFAFAREKLNILRRKPIATVDELSANVSDTLSDNNDVAIESNDCTVNEGSRNDDVDSNATTDEIDDSVSHNNDEKVIGYSEQGDSETHK